MIYWPSFFHQGGRILALCFCLFVLPLLYFCFALLWFFVFCIFNDFNFVLGHKTQKQLAFMTSKGVSKVCLFIYLLIYLKQNNYYSSCIWKWLIPQLKLYQKERKKNCIPLLPPLWHKFALLQIILGHQQASTLKCNV